MCCLIDCKHWSIITNLVDILAVSDCLRCRVWGVGSTRWNILRRAICISRKAKRRVCEQAAVCFGKAQSIQLNDIVTDFCSLADHLWAGNFLIPGCPNVRNRNIFNSYEKWYMAHQHLCARVTVTGHSDCGSCPLLNQSFNEHKQILVNAFAASAIGANWNSWEEQQTINRKKIASAETWSGMLPGIWL